MDKKPGFKFTRRTMMWACIICALVLIASVIIASKISSQQDNTYSIETSKLHIYN